MITGINYKMDVMLAHANGETVEFREKKKGLLSSEGYWRIIENKGFGAWDWKHDDYRIEPKLIFIPFSREDIPLDVPVWVRSKKGFNNQNSRDKLIVSIGNSGIYLGVPDVHTQAGGANKDYNFIRFSRLKDCYDISFNGGKSYVPAHKLAN